jgi:hypothetical protein
VKLPPQAAAGAVLRLSPLTPAGQPKFRLVWSEEPKTWVVGKFREESGGHISERFERKQIDKYPFHPPCWILEIWEPPEYFGTPEAWERSSTGMTEEGQFYHEIGPYPSEGDFRYLLKFTHKLTHDPIEPTEKLIEFLFSQRLKVPTRDDLAKERTAKEGAKIAQRSKRVAEAIGDVPFAGLPNNLNPKDLLKKLREDRILKEKTL